MSVMTIKRRWLVAAGVTAAMAASPVCAAKDAVIAVGSTFTSRDPFDAHVSLSPTVAQSLHPGLLVFDQEINLVNVLADRHCL